MKQSIIKGIVIGALVISTMTGCNANPCGLSDEWINIAEREQSTLEKFLNREITLDEYYNRMYVIADDALELEYPHEHDNTWECDECSAITVITYTATTTSCDALLYDSHSFDDDERTIEAWSDDSYMSDIEMYKGMIDGILNGDVDTARDTLKSFISEQN